MFILPRMVTAEQALPGRTTPILPHPRPHLVFHTALLAEPERGQQVIYLAAGCFWGVEEIMWALPGVRSTAVGYMGGFTPNPSYGEVCTGLTGHTETVRVVLDDAALPLVLKTFWESHDPTTLNRQGNDVGTQYRSAIFFTTPEQESLAQESRDTYNAVLTEHRRGEIVTDIRSAPNAGPFYLAEDDHQQYLIKVPNGYRCHTKGVACPMPGSGPLSSGQQGNSPLTR